MLTSMCYARTTILDSKVCGALQTAEAEGVVAELAVEDAAALGKQHC